MELCLTNSVWLDALTRVRVTSRSAVTGYHIPGGLKLVIRSSLRRSSHAAPTLAAGYRVRAVNVNRKSAAVPVIPWRRPSGSDKDLKKPP